MRREDTNMTEKILELLKDRRFQELKHMLSEANPVDLAEVLDSLDVTVTPILFRLLPKDLAAETFVELDRDIKYEILQRLTDREIKSVIDELFLDDTVDLIEEMPASVVKRLLSQSDSETRHYINEILKYPKDSAGSIMTIEYVYFRPSMTVEAAFDKIRKTAIDSETIYTCYVIDEKNTLIGFVSAKSLMLADKSDTIESIMERSVIYSHTTDDKEEVALKLADYGFLALPIVDKECRLVGIVTVDDAVDVLRDEASEDIAKMAATAPSDTPYLKMSVWQIFRSRIPWLLILMISATFTGLIINTFESRLNAISAVLFACVPMLMDTGGNCGAQASVTVIRALSLGELYVKDILKVIFKELRASILLGSALAVACFAKLLLIDNLLFGFEGYTPLRCAVVSLALLCTVVIAKLIGCSLPIIAKKFGLDPAVVASPFITTIVDALSLILYCALAISVLA